MGQIQYGRELHGTIELDKIGLAALLSIKFPRYVNKFCRHAQSTLLRFRTHRNSGHQLAAGNTQIQWLVVAVTLVLQQAVLARYAQISSAELNIGRYIGATQNQQAQALVVGRKYQLAAGKNILGRLNARSGQQR